MIWQSGKFSLFVGILALFATSALSEAPNRVLRPEERPASAARAQVGAPVVLPEAGIRVPRPPSRPAAVARHASEQAAIQPARASSSSTPRGGGLCGNAALQGRALGRVSGRGGCGIENAVELTAVHGVRMSSGLTVSCDAANAFSRWVGDVAIPAVGNAGGGLQRLDVGGYSCRPRNNQSGNQLSEHGKGNGVDVMGLRLRDGSNVTVLNGWNSGRWGSVLRQMHRSACGLFSTVLGPESNRFHRDHFHFDTARRRSGGAYCR